MTSPVARSPSPARASRTDLDATSVSRASYPAGTAPSPPSRRPAARLPGGTRAPGGAVGSIHAARQGGGALPIRTLRRVRARKGGRSVGGRGRDRPEDGAEGAARPATEATAAAAPAREATAAAAPAREATVASPPTFLVDVASGAARALPVDPSELVMVVAFDPSGALLATGETSGEVRPAGPRHADPGQGGRGRQPGDRRRLPPGPPARGVRRRRGAHLGRGDRPGAVAPARTPGRRLPDAAPPGRAPARDRRPRSGAAPLAPAAPGRQPGGGGRAGALRRRLAARGRHAGAAVSGRPARLRSTLIAACARAARSPR